MIQAQNPLLTGFNPDPSICRVGDDYYIATSTFEWFPGVQLHHSRDLVHWRLLGRALDRTSQLDMRGCQNSGGVWAPCLTHADGRFWLVYTNVHHHMGGVVMDTPNYLVTADSIEGPWSEPVFLNASGFDPSLFHDDDGQISLERRKGWLSLRGRDSLASTFDQSLVARRLQHFRARSETCVSFQPENFKQAAGLIAYYDRLHYHYLRLTSAGKGRLKLGVISSENTKASRHEVAELPLSAGERVFLRMENDHAELHFAWSLDGKDWAAVDRVFESTMLGDWVSPHSNFTGTFWGVCCQDLSTRTAWAHFDHFNYQPLA